MSTFDLKTLTPVASTDLASNDRVMVGDITADGVVVIELDELLDALLRLADSSAHVLRRVSDKLGILDPGGTPGTDEVQIYHDGTDGVIDSRSGQIKLKLAGFDWLAQPGLGGISFGEEAGVAVTSAIGFTGLGYHAGDQVTSAFGYTGVGYLCGRTVTVTGFTGVGYQCGQWVTSANGFTGVGYQAGMAIGTGDNNTCIGRSANTAGATTSESVALGAYSIAEDNTFVCGSTSTSIENVYFGEGITNASPVDYAINGTGGFGTNINGGAVRLAGGKGTGTGTGGSVELQYADAGSSGSSLNSLVSVLTVDSAGIEIGEATTRKVGFHGVTPVVQQSHIADPSGGAVVDSEARNAIDSILAVLESYGLTASA